MKRIFILAVIITIVLGLSLQAHAASDWQITLTVGNGTASTSLDLGSDQTALDGFDRVWDTPALLEGQLQVYFPHPEWGATHTKFQRDIRAHSPGRTMEWTAVVEYSAPPLDMTVTWDFLNVPNEFETVFKDLASGAEVDMRTDGSYSFIYSEERSFKVTVTIPAAEKVAIQKGFNLLAIPPHVGDEQDLQDWLGLDAGSTAIERIIVYDHVDERFVSMSPGNPENHSFHLRGGEGLIVYALEESEVESAVFFCTALRLNKGINIVGITCPPPGYASSDLLNKLNRGNIQSVQRFNSEKGAFETAPFFVNVPAGADFLFNAKEGYLLHMKNPITEFTP
jgi:hypothetical protein